MKSRGEMFYLAMCQMGSVLMPPSFESRPKAYREQCDQVAAEYDKATRAECDEHAGQWRDSCAYCWKTKDQAPVDLPDDVETFVQDVEARANKATPGPWVSGPSRDESGAAVFQRRGEDDFCLGREFEIDFDDAEFIANARTDIPRLIAIVREQGARNSDMLNALLDLRRATGSDYDPANGLGAKMLAKEVVERLERLAKLEDGIRSFTCEEGEDLAEVFYEDRPDRNAPSWIEAINEHRNRIETLRGLLLNGKGGA
jgi:hypothetical protein